MADENENPVDGETASPLTLEQCLALSEEYDEKVNYVEVVACLSRRLLGSAPS